MEYCEDGSDFEVFRPDSENDDHCDSDSNSSTTTEGCEAPKRKKTKLSTLTRVSEAQRACLNSYYSNGMTSTNKKHHNII